MGPMKLLDEEGVVAAKTMALECSRDSCPKRYLISRESYLMRLAQYSCWRPSFVIPKHPAKTLKVLISSLQNITFNYPYIRNVGHRNL